jgi:general secretion pathway protein C
VTLAASTAGTIVGLASAAAEPVDDPARWVSSDGALPLSRDKPPSKFEIAAGIVAANPFCPRCGDAVPPSARPVDQKLGLPRSSLPLVLLATMESTDPRMSLATIRDRVSSKTAPFCVADEVRPGVALVSVQRGRVVINNAGAREFIDLYEDAPAPKQESKPKPTSGPRPESEALPGARDAIQCANGHCRVDGKFVDELLANPGGLVGQARIRPVAGEARLRGFGFSGIKKNSLPGMLGLKNGDVLTEVNGQELASMDDALKLYTRLRSASHLSATVERKGKTRQITVEIERG